MTATAAVPPARSRGVLAVLVLISMVGPLSLNIAMPVLPLIQASLATGREQATLVLSLFLAGMAVAQLVLGPLADRLGRKPVLVGGLILYLAASLAAAFAFSIEWLLAARVIQSLGATVGLPLARTIIRDLYDRDQAASMIGYVTMGMVVAPMVSPFIGASIAEAFDWRGIFALCLVMGAVSIAAVVAVLPETRPVSLQATTSADVLRRSGALLGQKRFIGFAGTCACASAMFFAFQGGAPFLVINVMGVPASTYALWFMCGAGAYMAGNFISGRFSQRLGIQRMLLIGNWGSVAGSLLLLALALVPVMHPAALFLPMASTGFFNGMVIPNAVAGAVSVDVKAAGAASGLAGFLQSGLSALASFIVGAFVASNGIPIGVAMTVLAVGGLAFALMARSP